MKLLDCTLRDGGYYNDWDFREDIVSEYLNSVAEARINYVELGLRSLPKKTFSGAFAYTTEEFLSSIDLPPGPIYGVMVDAKTIFEADSPLRETISSMFPRASESKIGLVRIAAHFQEVEGSCDIARELKELGYLVGLNLMQAGGKPDSLIQEKAREIAGWETIDVLYFADSLGNMDKAEVERIVKALRKHWRGDLGIHAHNNMDQALMNTLAAKDIGVEWLDCTMAGMGRGAGNAQTERLLAVLCRNSSEYQPKPVYELVLRHFEPMRQEFGWGSNLLYMMGAMNDVHPTYIQNLMADPRYEVKELIESISYLSKIPNSSKYTGDILQEALNSNEPGIVIGGDEQVPRKFSSKEILVVANSPMMKAHKSAIERYIKKTEPVVIMINTAEALNEDFIDYYIISHNSKFLTEKENYARLKKPIILPKSKFKYSELKLLSGKTILDFGLTIKPGGLEAEIDHAIVPNDLTVAYLLGLLLAAKIKSISVVGFDGYESHDPRQRQMLEIISLFENNEAGKKITSLTPTTYPIEQRSIYAPV